MVGVRIWWRCKRCDPDDSNLGGAADTGFVGLDLNMWACAIAIDCCPRPAMVETCFVLIMNEHRGVNMRWGSPHAWC